MQMDPSHRKDKRINAKIKTPVAVHCTIYSYNINWSGVLYVWETRQGFFFYEEVKSIVLLNPDTFNHSMIINLFWYCFFDAECNAQDLHHAILWMHNCNAQCTCMYVYFDTATGLLTVMHIVLSCNVYVTFLVFCCCYTHIILMKLCISSAMMHIYIQYYIRTKQRLKYCFLYTLYTVL